MNRNFINDIRPRKSDSKEEEDLEVSSGSESSSPSPRKRGRGNVAWSIGGVVLAVLVGFFVYSTISSSATVVITPLSQTVTVDHIFVASLDKEEGSVPFELMTIEESATSEIPVDSIKNVEQKARGTITVTNKETKAQKFIAKTRFSSSEGKVFRIEKAVTIPAAIGAGADLKPGTLDVSVVADAAGPEYNIGPSDFTLPGLKGGPSYETVTGKSKLAMAGGSKGPTKIASAESLRKAKDSLTDVVNAKLLEKAKVGVPAGYILYQDGIFVQYEDIKQGASTDDQKLSVTLKGKLVGTIFKMDDLAKEIATRTIPNFTAASVYASNLDKGQFKILGKSSIDPTADRKFSFSMQGQVGVVWNVDTDGLAAALAGVSKKAYPDVLKGFSSVYDAKATFSPSWLRSFPGNKADISIEVNKPQ